jgi:3-oxoacyl-[acyl-carrier protein] reductase
MIGQVVIVTGVLGQIGSEIALALLSRGALVAGIDPTSLKENNPFHLDLIKSKDFLFFQGDCKKKKTLQKFISLVKKDLGEVTDVVACAGVAVFTPFLDRSDAELDFVYDVNLKGTINLIRQFLSLKTSKTKSSSVVIIASHYGVISPNPAIYGDSKRNSSEIYGATKAGLIQLARYYAVHASELNVRFNSVSPGGVLNKELQNDFFIDEYSKRCPMGRLASVSEVVGPVLFLLSSASSYVNGHNLVVDGGMTAW